MRGVARAGAIVAVIVICSATLASPAPGLDRQRPRARIVTRALVHGHATDAATRRPTSFGVLGGRTLSKGRAGVTSSPSGAPQATFGFDALSDPNAFPSDTTGARGDDFFVTAVNTQVAVYDPTGVAVVPGIQLDTLHPDTAGHFAFDPKVVYDQFHDTFLLVYGVQEDSPRRSSIVTVAIPDATATDTSTWCATRFPGDLVPGAPRVWADFPAVGYTPDLVTFSTNQFTFPSSTGTFRYAQVASMSSTAVYDCTLDPPVPDVFAGTQTRDPLGVQSFTIQPAQTVDALSGAQLLVSAEVVGKDSYLVLWRITATASGPQLKRGTVAIGKTGVPPSGTQGGGSIGSTNTYWDTGDGRLINAFYDADANQLFTAHAVFKDLKPDVATGSYPESAVRWYEVDPATKLKSSVLARKGTIGAPEVDAGWPSVATDSLGNLFVTYNRASAVTGEFLSAWVAEIAPGAIAATQLLLAPGTTRYERIPGIERWGDYTAISRDPVTPTLVATFNQYAASRTAWQQVVNVVDDA